MANPQPTDSHLRLANSILDELILRDFSKRQINIIYFILRLSWSCGKKHAVIPKYTKYFQLCGINNQNITNELNNLTINKVIYWDKDTNIFKINKDFDKWLIPYSKSTNIPEYKNLVKLNLKNSQNESNILETRDELLNFKSGTLKKDELFNSEKAHTEPIKDPSITNIITNNYNNDSKAELNEQEKKFINELREIENYPLDINKDISLLKKLSGDFPQVDPIEAIKAWSINKLDNPLDEKSKPRSQIRTWFSKGNEWGQYKKQSQKTEDTEDLKLTKQTIEFESPEDALRRLQAS